MLDQVRFLKRFYHAVLQLGFIESRWVFGPESHSYLSGQVGKVGYCIPRSKKLVTVRDPLPVIRQFLADLFKEAPGAGAQKAVIAPFVEASGENMLGDSDPL